MKVSHMITYNDLSDFIHFVKSTDNLGLDFKRYRCQHIITCTCLFKILCGNYGNLFSQVFDKKNRESNVTKELISRKNILVRDNFSFFHMSSH